MYKIMAVDGKEYGPHSFEQVKQWILEKRLERKTPVFPDGASDWIFLESLPEFSAIFNPPPVGASSANAGNSLNVIIPYKNICALIAYYLGVFSVIPFLGMPLGIAAFILGILALRFRRRNPAAGGVVHAWIGIVIGGLFGFLWLALIIWLFIEFGKHHR